MKTLVFGKTGQLAKAFQDLMPPTADTFYADRRICELSNQYQITQLLEQFRPDVIINTAAFTAVDLAESEINHAFAINAIAPELMAEYAKKNQAIFLHYSSDYVFDGTKSSPYIETDRTNPLSQYGKSKCAGEEAIQAIFSSHEEKMPYYILRTSWVYGQGSNFIRTILRLAKEKSELKVVSNQFGAPTSAEWLAELSLALINFDGGVRPKSGIYNAVPQGEVSWYGLACFVMKEAIDLGVKLNVQPEAVIAGPASAYPLPAPRPLNSRMSTHKLKHALKTHSELLQIEWQVLVKKYLTQLHRQGLV
ncbi:MAG: dTDP-4-dehydrorhamnose reductase [Polynucleobacter sp.]|nr:dTDP-4-dehydrorhamnose reductase [Polynucleobacter sp.]